MGSSVFVVNASPLIVLGRLAHLDLLPRLAEAVFVPRGVLDEVGAKLEKDWVAREVAAHPRLRVVDDAPIPPDLELWELGRGETCVIAYARAHASSTAVLDDMRARRAAVAFGVPVTGTLGILVQARQAGLIPAVAPLIDAMRDLGFYAHDDLVREVLARVGEAPGA